MRFVSHQKFTVDQLVTLFVPNPRRLPQVGLAHRLILMLSPLVVEIVQKVVHTPQATELLRPSSDVNGSLFF